MLAPISNTASGSASVSSAQASTSAGSFSDLLDSLVQTRTSADESSTTPSAMSGRAVPSDVADVPNAVPDATVADSASALQLPDSKHVAVSSEQVKPDVLSTDCKTGALVDTTSVDVEAPKPPVDDDKKDDSSDAVTLLSLIPTVVPAAVLPVNLELKGNEASLTAPGTSASDGIHATTSSVVSADGSPDTMETSAGAQNREQTGRAEQAAAIPGQEFSSAFASAPDQAKRADEGSEKVEKSLSQHTAEQSAILESVVRKAEAQTGESASQAATRIASPENAAMPQPLIGDAAKQTQSPEPGDEVLASQLGDKVQASQSDRLGVDRAVSKERESVRPVRNDLEAEVDATSGSTSPDSNPVAPLQAVKAAESAVRQDIPSPSMVADVHANGTSSRSEQASPNEAFSEAASSSADPSMHAATQSSWMNSVRLMERVNQAEMRVGIQSDFGDIAVKAAMNHHQLAAEISVQHAGLRDAIAAEIPSLQAKLSEQHIPMTDVSVTADPGGGSNAGSSGFQQWSQNGEHAAQSSISLRGQGPNEHDPVNSAESLEQGTGLDIRI